MNWRVKIRTGTPRPQPSGRAASDRPGSARGSAQQRHPAMSGLDVSPVHGRHCICHRCERHTQRDAA
jgi:hypothetical protein